MTTPSSSDPLDDPLVSGEPVGGWLDEGERFAITFAGSSSCYAVPTKMTTPGSNLIELTLERAGGAACTADMALRTHTIRTPEGINPSKGAEVTGTDGDWAILLPPLDRRTPESAGGEREIRLEVGTILEAPK